MRKFRCVFLAACLAAVLAGCEGTGHLLDAIRSDFDSLNSASLKKIFLVQPSGVFPFDPDIHEYSISCTTAINQLVLGIVVNNQDQAMQIETEEGLPQSGALTSSDFSDIGNNWTIPFSKSNAITITIESKNRWAFSSYNLLINKSFDASASLSDLHAASLQSVNGTDQRSALALSPAFSPEVFEYTIVMPTDGRRIELKPTSSAAVSQITIYIASAGTQTWFHRSIGAYASSEWSSSIALDPGTNLLELKVESAAARHYYTIWVRPPA